MNGIKIYTIDDIKKSLAPVFKENGVKSAVLFGSYAKGFADENSDVDILVDRGERNFDIIYLNDYARRALGDKKVDLVDFRDMKKDSEIACEIKETGVPIYGRTKGFTKSEILKKRRNINMSMQEYRRNKNIIVMQKIIGHINTIKDYAKGTTIQDFLGSKMLREACVFNIFQIGELANNFRDEFVKTHSHLPLIELRGLRNRIAHGYDTVDAEKIGDIIYNDLDKFKEQLQEIIKNGG
ncbi:MAG: DUF86 domain-containing protein [Oscillospiraceae bacterium]|nr:DUF86 domain-containing protein [Oscillospiraceae bacterium]